MKKIIKIEKLNIPASNNKKSRKCWEESFKAMAQAGDDQLLDPEIFSLESDEEDWQW